MAAVIAKFFKSQAKPLADQIIALRDKTGKADDESDSDKQIEAILNGLDLEGWAMLADDVEPLMAGAMRDGTYAAIAQIQLDTEARNNIVNILNEDVKAYAADRSAELVGMRRTENGFVENPNAEWVITDSTRVYLRASVEGALDEGWSNQKLADHISESYGFSDERAIMIARTETNMASNAGAYTTYKESGVVEGKQWVTSNDDKVSEDCAENGTCGVGHDGVLMDLEEDFPSGELMPPNHPNCRCVIVPVVNFD